MSRDDGGDAVRYFAFGANMASDVLCKRRGLRISGAEPARLRGYAMRFSAPGLPLIEPAFANIEPDPGAECWGVLYQMPQRDLDDLVELESGAYSLLEVEVEGAESGPVLALAFCDERRRDAGKPSRRYRDLLLRGAREHDLPEPYLARLAAEPVAYVPLLSEAFEWVVLRPAIFLRSIGLRHEHAIVRVVNAYHRMTGKHGD